MAEIRSEIILRLPNLSPATAQMVADKLEPLARRLGGSLSKIDREQHSDHAIHLGRTKIV